MTRKGDKRARIWRKTEYPRWLGFCFEDGEIEHVWMWEKRTNRDGESVGTGKRLIPRGIPEEVAGDRTQETMEGYVFHRRRNTSLEMFCCMGEKLKEFQKVGLYFLWPQYHLRSNHHKVEILRFNLPLDTILIFVLYLIYSKQQSMLPSFTIMH